MVIEQGARTEELTQARAECEAERDELEEQLKQCEDDLAGLRGWKPAPERPARAGLRQTEQLRDSPRRACAQEVCADNPACTAPLI